MQVVEGGSDGKTGEKWLSWKGVGQRDLSQNDGLNHTPQSLLMTAKWNQKYKR